MPRLIILMRSFLQVLLRCRWAPGLEFRAAWIAGVAHGIASALAYLHAHHICHGVHLRPS